jgi:hypothetical protein
VRSLPDRQRDPQPVAYRFGKNVLCLSEIIAGVQYAVDFRAVFGPLLDLE